MPRSVLSFSSSKFKLHNGGLSSSELIRKKREQRINNDIEVNNNIKIRDNKIVSVTSYSTYIDLTRPKHVGVYSKEIVSGHNLYKVVNKNGSIKERGNCLSDHCDLGVTGINVDYLEKSVEEQTNIDMSFNLAIAEAEEGSSY